MAIVFIDMPPTGLDHSYPRIREMVNCLVYEFRVRNKVSIKYGDVLPSGYSQPFLKCSRLESGPIASMDIMNVKSLAAKGLDTFLCHVLSLVGGIVQNLNLH